VSQKFLNSEIAYALVILFKTLYSKRSNFLCYMCTNSIHLRCTQFSCIHLRCTQFNRTRRFTRWIGISRDFPIGAICLPYPATSCSLPAVSPALFSIPRLVCLFCKTWGTFQCFSRSRFFCHLRKPWPHLQKEGGNSKKVRYFTLRSYSLPCCIMNFSF
jgi:hypothetical protein